MGEEASTNLRRCAQLYVETSLPVGPTVAQCRYVMTCSQTQLEPGLLSQSLGFVLTRNCAWSPGMKILSFSMQSCLVRSVLHILKCTSIVGSNDIFKSTGRKPNEGVPSLNPDPTFSFAPQLHNIFLCFSLIPLSVVPHPHQHPYPTPTPSPHPTPPHPTLKIRHWLRPRSLSRS